MICTDRLIGERLCEDHYDFIHLMHQNVAVMHHLGGKRSPEETQAYFDFNLDHWDKYAYGIWVLKEKTSGTYIGRGGLRNAIFDEKQEVEIAYGLLPEFWRQGFATEFVQELWCVGFKKLGLESLVSITVPDNLPSRHVLDKFGFSQECEILHNNKAHILYRLKYITSGSNQTA